MPNPYHVRLAISQYGDRFRAELFTEDLGDTDGELLPADWRESFTRWMDYLQGGGKPTPESDADIGGQLFDWLFGSRANRTKWTEVLARAEREGNRPVRVLIDSSTLAGPAEDADTDRIHNLPYGLLFDRQRDTFIFRPQPGKPPIRYVRIVRRCTPRLLNLERSHWPLRVLLAVAEPEGLTFDGAREVARLAKGLSADPGALTVFVCTPNGPRLLGEVLAGPAESWTAESLSTLCRTTPEQLASALAAQRYDLLHVVAHGSAGGLVLCDANGRRTELRARELCEWCKVTCSCSPACVGPCRLNPRVQLAFLQVCRAAGTREQGCFGGLAQKLINPDGGDLAAVVASPYVLEADQSTGAALEFYKRLTREETPDEALFRNLAMANWAWAFLELWVRPSALRDTGARGAFQFVSPYRGLASFKERDADVFFGREKEVEDYRTTLANEPVLVIAGDSGSGKSSVLYAGLAHRVRRDGLAGVGGWRIVTVRPGREPARNLLTALLLHEEPGRLQLPAPGEWGHALTALLATSIGPDHSLLLIVDQFEEIFTLCTDGSQRETAAKALAEAATRAGDHFRLVVGMRNDYLGQAVTLPGLGQWLQRPRILRPPTAEAVRAIVVRPAEVTGYRFEGPLNDSDNRHQQSLVDRILGDPLLSGDGVLAGKTATPLPLLEFALEKLWQLAVGNGSWEFKHKDYDGLGGSDGERGGLGGAIAQHADEAYDLLTTTFPQLGSQAQKLAQQLFTSLVDPAHHTRHPCRRLDIEERSGRVQDLRAVIDYFAGERLITIRTDPNDPNDTLVDLAHEILIQRWKKLRSWLETDQVDQLRMAEFQRDCQRFSRKGRTRSLPHPQTQQEYLEWVKRANPGLTTMERAFVQAMKRATRLRKWGWTSATVTTAVVAIIMFILWRVEEHARHDAQDATNKAKTATGLAIQSNRKAIDARNETLRNKYISDLNLIGDYWQQSEITRLDDLLQKQPRYLRDFEWYYWKRLRRTEAHSLQGKGDLLCVAATADGKLVAAGGADGTVYLWEMTSSAPMLVPLERHHQGPVWAVAFSASGKWLASGSSDETISIWDLQERKFACTLAKHHAPIWSIAFRPNADLLASGSENGLLKLWSVTEKKEISSSLSYRWVRSIAFTPDGGQLATGTPEGRSQFGTPEGRIQFWTLPSLQLKNSFQAGSDHLWSVAVSPDGRRLAVASGSKVLVRSLADPRDEVQLLGHKDQVVSACFGPTSDDVISVSLDRTIKAWRLEGRNGKTQARESHTLRGHRDSVLGVCVNDNRKNILTSSSDGTVRLWTDASWQEPESLQMESHPIPHNTFSPIGKTGLVSPAALATYYDRAIHSSVSKRPAAPVGGYPSADVARGLAERHNAFCFSGDGRKLASWFQGALEFWDVPRKTRIRKFWIVDAAATTVFALDHSGLRLAQAGQSGPLKIWELATDPPVFTTINQLGPIRSLAFSPKGNFLAAGACDDKVIVWDLDTKARKAVLSGHRGPIWALAISPDGRWLASGDEAGTVRSWDLTRENASPVVMTGHEQRVWSLAFSNVRDKVTSNNGGLVLSRLPPLLASGSEDRTVKIWDQATGMCRCTFTGHTEPVWSVAFNADGTRVVSSGKEKILRIWDPNYDVAQEVLRLSDLAQPVVAVAFCAGEPLVAAASIDGIVSLWRALPYRLAHDL